jgi:hypothetical protein
MANVIAVTTKARQLARNNLEGFSLLMEGEKPDGTGWVDESATTQVIKRRAVQAEILRVVRPRIVAIGLEQQGGTNPFSPQSPPVHSLRVTFERDAPRVSRLAHFGVRG